MQVRLQHGLRSVCFSLKSSCSLQNWGFRRFTKQQRLHHMRSIGADEHAQHNTKIWFHDSLKRGCSQDEIDAVRRHEDGKARKRRREAAWCAKSAVVQHEHSSGSDGAADAHDKVDILSFVATRRLETEGWSGTTRPQPVQAGPSRTTQTRTGTYGGWTAHPPLIGFSDPRAFVLGTSTPVPATNPPLPAIRPAPTTAAFELDASFAPRAATRSSSIPFTSSSLSLVRHTADEAYAFESSQSQGRWSPGIDSSGSLMSVSTPKAAGQPGSSGGEMTGEVWDHGLTRGASELFERVHW